MKDCHHLTFVYTFCLDYPLIILLTVGGLVTSLLRYCLQYVPPLIPPRGEVNAADAFDIGNFDDDETKGIKLCDKDQELYSEFGLVVSSRWQKEVCGTAFSFAFSLVFVYF